ncbi:MAG: HD domain-containing protein [Lentisphaeria bacterium]|nr:HD domain-containing protein [Lentisphaeria bacterium]
MREIIDFFYPQDDELRQLLIEHSEKVCRKALEIAAVSGLELDLTLVEEGAMLHDIGIFKCHAPDIFCNGTAPYITHGIIGGKLLREYGANHGLDLEKHARICERHTGSGLSVEDIKSQKLPLPERDFLPETPEEKLVCLADKFFSKSADQSEKSVEKIHKSMSRFSPETQKRFEELCRLFKLQA